MVLILVDDRTGSKDLAERLPDAHVVRLPFADAAFLGHGPEGSWVFVGVEVKQVSDVLKCIADGRFAGHQLPGLVETYDAAWLVVEGRYRADREGLLEVPRQRGWETVSLGHRYFMWRDLESWLVSMQMKGRIHVKHTYSRAETARYIQTLEHWWTDKTWEEHRAHLALDTSDRPLLVDRPRLVRRLAKELPGIGWGKSAAVERHFASALEMVLADEKEWREVEGIGKILARRIVAALQNNGEARKVGGKKDRTLP